MDENNDPNQWIQIDENNFSDVSFSDDSQSEENQNDNLNSNKSDENKEQSQNEDQDTYLGQQLKQNQNFDEINTPFFHIKESFGVEQNIQNDQEYNPFLSPFIYERPTKNNYEPPSSRITQSLEHSVFDQTSYNQLEQSQLQSSNLNTSILRFQNQQTNNLNCSMLPDFMSKSHIDKLNRGNLTSIQKKKTVYTINISSFQKVQNQYSSYVVYIINSNWSDISQEINHTVKRRFNEFKNLNQFVSKQYIGNVQPYFPLPTIQETILPFIKYIKDEEDYLIDRQKVKIILLKNSQINKNVFIKKLETYLKKLAKCDFILDNEVFETFLSGPQEFNVTFDDKKEQINIAQQYMTTLSGMFVNFKSLVYKQEMPYLSLEDQDQQDFLNSLIKQIQDNKNILLALINEIKKIPYDELEQYLKNGENAAETEITQIDQQNINFQQNFLSEFYKKYQIQREINIIELLSSFLDQIIDSLNDAETSYENFMSERNKLVQQLNRKDNIDHNHSQNEDSKYDNQNGQILQQMENSHIQIIKINNEQEDMNNLNEQQNAEQIIISKLSLQNAGKNLIQELSVLLTIKFPAKIQQFTEKVRGCFLDHYKSEIQLYEEALNPLLY